MKVSNSILGIITAIASVFLFSTYAIFGKILLENLTAETFIALSQAISVSLVLLVYGFLPELKKLQSLPKKKIAFLIVISILSAVVAPLLFLKGLDITMATNAMIIGKIEPVLVGIISVLWIHETFNRLQVLGSVLMLSGVMYVATEGFSNGMALNTGDILIILGALSGAMTTSIFKKYLNDITPEIVVLMRNGIGSIILLIILPLFFDFTHSTEKVFSQEILVPLILFAIFTVIFAQMLWYKSLTLIDASKLSIFSMLGPLFGITMAIFILGEEISGFHILGFTLVIIGLIITLHHQKKHPNHEKHMRIKHFFHH